MDGIPCYGEAGEGKAGGRSAAAGRAAPQAGADPGAVGGARAGPCPVPHRATGRSSSFPALPATIGE